MEFSFPFPLPKVENAIFHSRSCSRYRSIPGITTSRSRSQNSGMEFPFPIPFPKIGNEIFIPVPVPESWECNLSFPFPFPKFGNGLSHSRSQMSKSHSRSPLQGKWLGGRKYMRQLSCTNRHIGKTPFFLWQFGDCWNFPRDISIIQN